jgi:hypothetical protein
LCAALFDFNRAGTRRVTAATSPAQDQCGSRGGDGKLMLALYPIMINNWRKISYRIQTM